MKKREILLRIIAIFIIGIFTLKTYGASGEILETSKDNNISSNTGNFLNTINKTKETNSGVTEIKNEVESGINIKTLDIEDELKKDGIELDAAKEITEKENIVEQAYRMKNDGIEKLVGESKEEKNIKVLKDAISELNIKKELNEDQLKDIQENLKSLKENIKKNNENLELLKDGDKSNEINEKLQEIKSENKNLVKELELKESVINDLESNIKGYNILNTKYKKLLETYVDTKKEKDNSELLTKKQKIITLIIFLIIFAVAYFIKFLLVKNNSFNRKYKDFSEYFHFVYGLSFIIFIILYSFYLFPELNGILVLISGTLIIANSQVISSFIASLILFRNFKIGNIIEVGEERGKIIKFNPLTTVIKRVNTYGVLGSKEINIPNIDLLKNNVIIEKNNREKENVFSIIFSLSKKTDLFEIMKNIESNILKKKLKDKLNTLAKTDESFKIKYEYIDSDKIKITFYWIADNQTNREIEKDIIKYLKNFPEYIDDNSRKHKNNISIDTDKENDYMKKTSVIFDEISS